MPFIEKILSALLQKKATIPPKSIDVYLTNPVADATGYNHFTPVGVSGWRKG
ncbi:hypothetical protein ADICYQ_3123 [Cyclobacterium qasimii M12-11B]|uniref:Uncharacterized protein n=1 Tax=Cyclobacterium qasimii M12-11B TaxID=641524 RepID=S7VDH1_9BACT|nr:hypothetical protein ADICYQ_3123 [Cyclobacterium qasimii M12-11B]